MNTRIPELATLLEQILTERSNPMRDLALVGLVSLLTKEVNKLKQYLDPIFPPAE